LSSAGIIPKVFSDAIYALFTGGGFLITLISVVLASIALHPSLLHSIRSELSGATPTASSTPATSAQAPLSETTPPQSPHSDNSDKPAPRSIIGFPPPTDPRTIQQREKVVKEVYDKLTQPDIAAIVLTGIGGVGKSTLAALVYKYAEEQHSTTSKHFTAEPLWLTVNEGVTMADLVGTLLEALEKSLSDVGSLPSARISRGSEQSLSSSSINSGRMVICFSFHLPLLLFLRLTTYTKYFTPSYIIILL
jgi:hypothetical protein